MIAPLGMTAAASGYVSGPRAISGNPFHFTNWPQGWIELYTASEFLLADPLPRWARASGKAISWSQLIVLLPARDPGRRVIAAAAQFNFTEGMAIPARSASGHLGLIAFGGGRSALSSAEQAYLTLIGRTVFEAADRIEMEGEDYAIPPILSAREIDFLALLVHGHSDQQISRFVGVTLPTVRFHLSNARKKLGAVSRTHLAALAVAYGYSAL